MKVAAVTLTMAAALSACTIGGARMQEPAAATTPAACRADAVRQLVGTSFQPAMAEQARLASGALSVRVVRPGDMVTKDFREDRLTIRLDERGTVLSAGCV